jgi:hypothetical protein
MMPLPPYRSLVVHHFQRSPSEAAKYVRTEFGDTNSTWLLAEASSNGHSRRPGDSKKKALAEVAVPELASPVIVGDGCGADH